MKRPLVVGFTVLAALWPAAALAQTDDPPDQTNPCDLTPMDWCLDREEPGEGTAAELEPAVRAVEWPSAGGSGGGVAGVVL